MKILKPLINGFWDLPTVLTFHFVEKKTHYARKDPQVLSYSIAKLHSNVLRTGRRGTYQIKDLTNMEETLLSCVMEDVKAYTDKGSSELWCATHGLGLDKKQCSVQLTNFADGKPRVTPLIIFRNKGLRIRSRDQDALDRHVQLLFQEKTWCDEPVMLDWISQQWNNCLIHPLLFHDNVFLLKTRLRIYAQLYGNISV